MKNNLKQHNQKVKEYLYSIGEMKEKIKYIEEQIRELRLSKMMPSINQDGLPHGSSQRDLSDYAAAVEKLEEERLELIKKRSKRILDVRRKCDYLKKEEAEILWQRYLERKSWKEIAYAMSYSPSHIYRIHSKALQNFDLEDLTL